MNLNFDPIVLCEWLPNKVISLSEYNSMISYFLRKDSPKFINIDKCIKEYENAKSVHIKKSPD